MCLAADVPLFPTYLFVFSPLAHEKGQRVIKYKTHRGCEFFMWFLVFSFSMQILTVSEWRKRIKYTLDTDFF